MKRAGGLTGEVSDHKVAGVFGEAPAADAAAATVRSALELGDAQVLVVRPGDAGVGLAAEPEERGIARTIVRTHVLLGLAGAVLGGVVFAVLWSMGVPMIVQSATLAAAVLVVFGAVAGLMAGGLVSLRPDHDPYNAAIRDAHEQGRAVVIVHAFSASQCAAADEQLRRLGAQTVRTL